MSERITFNHVSKQYRLGLTRTSLPSVMSNWFRHTLYKTDKRNSDNNILHALDDVSFSLKSQESLALIGPNGAGKTTILKLISKITRPTSGDIHVNGRLSALIELGAGFHPDLSGRENIYLNGSILGLTRNEINDRFNEIVDFSELERFIDTPIKRYSSGMVVRLGFAVAACINPEILLVDEVLAVGDASFRQKCIKRIEDLLNKGTSLIFVSHNMGLIQAVCSTGLYLESGQIQFYGDTKEAIAMYDRAVKNRHNVDMDKQTISADTNSDKGVVSHNDIVITSVEVVGENGKKSDPYSNLNNMRIDVSYEAFRSLGPVYIDVRITRSDGLSCIFLKSKLDKHPLDLQMGTGVISVILEPLQLYNGSYYVSATIKDAKDLWGLARGWSEVFYVTDSNHNPDDQEAVFEPNRSWQHYKDYNISDMDETISFQEQ